MFLYFYHRNRAGCASVPTLSLQCQGDTEYEELIFYTNVNMWKALDISTSIQSGMHNLVVE